VDSRDAIQAFNEVLPRSALACQHARPSGISLWNHAE
jgi:hypothetical protein